MAITRTLAQLAADIRLGDGASVPTGAVAVVLERVAASARAMVLAYAPDAPDAIHNEAYVRLAGYLYDSPQRTITTRSALKSSGAGSILAPYRVRRGGLIASTAATVAAGDPTNPVANGVRRVVTVEVEADGFGHHSFTSAPLADPLLTVEGAHGVLVEVDVAADSGHFVGAWGVRLADGGARWTVPRSVAALRFSAHGGPATFQLSILEAA